MRHYQRDNATIMTGDCHQLLRRDHEIYSAMVTDPPSSNSFWNDMDFHDWLIAHSFDRVLTKDAKIIILTNPQDGYWFYDRATRVTHRVSEPALKTIATPQHPYTRPVEPLIRILRHYQIAGPLCDPYCGSGSIMVAAHALGIQSVAIDIVPAYAVAAASRISVQP